MTPIAPKKKIAIRLLGWVMLTALVVGALLGLTQVWLDAQRAIVEFDDDADQLLQVVRRPATQAVYSIDKELAEQVIEGLFKQRSIRFAAIAHPDGAVLAEKSRPLAETSYRWLSDPIFKTERAYTIQLYRNSPEPTLYGELKITLDTAVRAETFLDRALVVLVSGLLRAMILGGILFFICHILLTRPIMALIREISTVDPTHPGEKTIPVPKGHKKDEIGNLTETANTLFSAIADNQKKRRAAEARVLKLSQYDPLTGLPNRLMFNNHLESAIEDAKKLKQKVAVFCCGIDDFKSINEQHDYSIGDVLLQKYAERLTQTLDTPCIASRLGGDQFALLIYNVQSAFVASELVDTLLLELEQPFKIHDFSVTLHTTIGITLFPDDGEQPDKLLQKSEQTMTLAKTVSRNQYQFYVASVDSEMRRRKKLASDLTSAIKNNEMFLVFQPQIDFKTNTVSGAEALLRWQHPEHGFIPPDEFIPIAENEGSIIEIGTWVMHQACKQMNIWKRDGLTLKVSINLSANQLRQPNIEKIIAEILREHNIDPSMIDVEVTETGFIENLNDATQTLQEIKDQGITTSVDDFGTGYSSLSYLKQLPIDNIKIDKQFVKELFISESDTTIVNSVIQLGKTLKLKVIAEGVETKEQDSYLRQIGCDVGQGYYYSKPVKPDDFFVFVSKFNKKATTASS